MKFHNSIKIRFTLAAAMMLAGVVAYLLGFAEYHWQVGGTHVAVYPAIFVALLGIVQLWRAVVTQQKSH